MVGGQRQEQGTWPQATARTAQVNLFAAYELGEDELFGHIKPRKNRSRLLGFCRYLRSVYPLSVRIAIICDNFSPT